MPIPKRTPADDLPQNTPTGGMWQNDIVFGGEQLEPNVTLGDPYILWDCGVVARNVSTSLGDDAVKVEVVLSQLDGGEVTQPRKFGTFASSIAAKVEKRQDGDLPAVVKFEKVQSSFDTDAFVMTFVQRYQGTVPGDLPPITAL